MKLCLLSDVQIQLLKNSPTGPAKEPHAEDLVKAMILQIEPNESGALRPGTEDTPRRVVKSWDELYAGYKMNPETILSTQFEQEGYKTDQIILCKNIELFSQCEHHLLPFMGRAHVAYIPGERVVGLSKLARLVECFSRRLQIQEKFTNQIADAMEKVLKPRGVAVVISAKHFCMCARGVGKQSSSMVTSAMRGVFLEKPEARSELMALIGE